MIKKAIAGVAVGLIATVGCAVSDAQPTPLPAPKPGETPNPVHVTARAGCTFAKVYLSETASIRDVGSKAIGSMSVIWEY